jgi:carboxylesterase
MRNVADNCDDENSIVLTDFALMRQGRKSKPLADSSSILPQSIDDGEDKAVLLIHGFSSTPATFRHLVPQLRAQGYAVSCPRLPGHAQSYDDFSNAVAHSWEQAVYLNYEQLRTRFKHIDVIGLSLGGVLAYQLALKQQINSLCLLAPCFRFFYPIPLAQHLIKTANKLGLKKIPAIAGNIHSGDNFEVAYKHIPTHALFELFGFLRQIKIKQPGCPTTIYLGRHDRVISSNKVAKLFQSMPNVTVNWLDNAAHVIPLETQVTLKACDELILKL